MTSNGNLNRSLIDTYQPCIFFWHRYVWLEKGYSRCNSSDNFSKVDVRLSLRLVLGSMIYSSGSALQLSFSNVVGWVSANGELVAGAWHALVVLWGLVARRLMYVRSVGGCSVLWYTVLTETHSLDSRMLYVDVSANGELVVRAWHVLVVLCGDVVRTYYSLLHALRTNGEQMASWLPEHIIASCIVVKTIGEQIARSCSSLFSFAY
jgi:hypothetical protein